MKDHIPAPKVDDAVALAKLQDYVAPRKVLIAVRYGSELYGTAMEDSDTDIRAVVLPTPEEILTGKVDFSIESNTSHAILGAEDFDILAFSLKRFLRLLDVFDAGAVEMLFASRAAHACLTCDPLLDEIHQNASRVIGLNTNTPIGYARSALHSLIPDQDDYLDSHQRVLNVLSGLEDEARVRDSLATLKSLAEIPGIVFWTQQHSSAEEFHDGLPDYVFSGNRPAYSSLMFRVRSRSFSTGMRARELRPVFEKAVQKAREQIAKRKAQKLAVTPREVYHGVRLLRQIVELADTGQVTFPRPERDLLMQLRREDLAEEEVIRIVEETFRASSDAEDRLPFNTSQDEAYCRNLLIRAHLDEIKALI